VARAWTDLRPRLEAERRRALESSALELEQRVCKLKAIEGYAALLVEDYGGPPLFAEAQLGQGAAFFFHMGEADVS